MERNRRQTERIKKINLKMNPPIPISYRNLHTLRTLSTAAALTTNIFVYSSTRNSLLIARKMSWIVTRDDDHDCQGEFCRRPDRVLI